MSGEHRFAAPLAARGPKGAWVFIEIPFDVENAFGSKGRVPVSGTINGFPFRTSVLPQGDGTHAMPVNKAMQAGARAAAGDTVEVALARDAGERDVEVPPELARALDAAPAQRATFEAFSYSHRKEYAQWVSSAKKLETRLARAAKAVEMLRDGKQFR